MVWVQVNGEETVPEDGNLRNARRYCHCGGHTD